MHLRPGFFFQALSIAHELLDRFDEHDFGHGAIDHASARIVEDALHGVGAVRFTPTSSRV